MKRTSIVCAVLLVLPGAAAWADSPPSTAPSAADFLATLASGSQCSPLQLAGGLEEPPGTDADCSARCQNGSTVSCTGTSCEAADWSCSSGQRGYCWSNWEGYKYCPVPTCPCYAQARCNDGSYVSCTGYNHDCFAVYGCYAHCDSQYYLCPNPGPSCPL
jgi:hypothetical protein